MIHVINLEDSLNEERIAQATYIHVDCESVVAKIQTICPNGGSVQVF